MSSLLYLFKGEGCGFIREDVVDLRFDFGDLRSVELVELEQQCVLDEGICDESYEAVDGLVQELMHVKNMCFSSRGMEGR